MWMFLVILSFSGFLRLVGLKYEGICRYYLRNFSGIKPENKFSPREKFHPVVAFVALELCVGRVCAQLYCLTTALVIPYES